MEMQPTEGSQPEHSTPSLTNAQIFSANWDSKAERVLSELLRTAIEFPQSEISEHMHESLRSRKDLGLRTTDVEQSLKNFVEKQTKETNDSTWREIGRKLFMHQSGAQSNATISHAVLRFISDYRYPSNTSEAS